MFEPRILKEFQNLGVTDETIVALWRVVMRYKNNSAHAPRRLTRAKAQSEAAKIRYHATALRRLVGASQLIPMFGTLERLFGAPADRDGSNEALLTTLPNQLKIVSRRARLATKVIKDRALDLPTAGTKPAAERTLVNEAMGVLFLQKLPMSKTEGGPTVTIIGRVLDAVYTPTATPSKRPEARYHVERWLLDHPLTGDGRGGRFIGSSRPKK